jgi:DNA-binding response OmpR family regulator
MATNPVPPLPPARIPGPPAVLVIEPDKPWSEAVCGAFREKGLAPAPAADAEEARWRLHERRYDVLVLSTAIGDIALESLMADLHGHGVPPPVLLIEDRRDGAASEAWRFLRAARTLRRPCRVRDVIDAALVLVGRAGTGRAAMA